MTHLVLPAKLALFLVRHTYPCDVILGFRGEYNIDYYIIIISDAPTGYRTTISHNVRRILPSFHFFSPKIVGVPQIFYQTI